MRKASFLYLKILTKRPDWTQHKIIMEDQIIIQIKKLKNIDLHICRNLKIILPSEYGISPAKRLSCQNIKPGQSHTRSKLSARSYRKDPEKKIGTAQDHHHHRQQQNLRMAFQFLQQVIFNDTAVIQSGNLPSRCINTPQRIYFHCRTNNRFLKKRSAEIFVSSARSIAEAAVNSALLLRP